MKNLLIALSFAAMPAFGSHFVQCNLEMEVTKVSGLARLDGEAVFGTGLPGSMKPDYEQVVALKVRKASQVEGRGCPTENTLTTLAVKPEQVGNYKKGDVLNVRYRNSGNRNGSQISYYITK